MVMRQQNTLYKGVYARFAAVYLVDDVEAIITSDQWEC